jgi:enoyl-CoA hydratase
MEPVRYEVAERVATLTLDSPSNRNALSSALTAALLSGLAAAGADPEVRAVVLTHTGRTFCAGADLSESSSGPGGDRTRSMVTLIRAILELPKPVVGRIDGHVRAGGMGLVAACDLVVAGPSCTFALTEARLGLAAAVISPVVLARLTPGAASRYFLTGETFGPSEAAAAGLVSVHAEDPDPALADLLAKLRLGSPQGLAASKALTTAARLAELDARADDLAARSADLFASAEAREGMLAFLEKRPPSWAV